MLNLLINNVKKNQIPCSTQAIKVIQAVTKQQHYISETFSGVSFYLQFVYLSKPRSPSATYSEIPQSEARMYVVPVVTSAEVPPAAFARPSDDGGTTTSITSEDPGDRFTTVSIGTENISFSFAVVN